jgi:hypothetical protein
VTIDLKKRLLQHVRRIGLAGQTAGETIDAALIATQEHFERLVVAGSGAHGERLVSLLRCRDVHAHRVYRVLMAAFTLAASSGVTSVTP